MTRARVPFVVGLVLIAGVSARPASAQTPVAAPPRSQPAQSVPPVTAEVQRVREELERLRGSVLEGFKEFEFGLRRQLAGKDREGPVLGGSSDVPQAYRDMVDEYFRSLSRRSGKKQ